MHFLADISMMRFMANQPRVTPDDPQLTALIDGERMRMLFAPTGEMVIVGSIVAVVLALVVGPQVGQMQALCWAALCVTAGAIRMVHARAYHRSQDRLNPRWLTTMTWLTGFNGLAWARRRSLSCRCTTC